jgi:hypothetical protein
MTTTNIKYVPHDHKYTIIEEAIISDSTVLSYNTDKLDFSKTSRLSLKKFDETGKEVDNKLFCDRIHLPHPIASLNGCEIDKFSTNEKIRIIDMPIKFPKTSVRYPGILSDFSSIIELVAQHEALTNPEYNDLYLYLTIDRTDTPVGKYQRRPGIHSDGRNWICQTQDNDSHEDLNSSHGELNNKPSTYVEPRTFNTYIVCNKYPTEFFNKKFSEPSSWDKPYVDFFNEFTAQQQGNDDVVTYPVNTILAMNEYCLHRSAPATDNGYRSFCKIIVANTRLHRMGNAKNPCFNYDWTYDSQMLTYY